jgi:hypothetical protein
MDKPFPILVSIDTNEAHRPRAERFRKALVADRQFLLGKAKSLSHDLRFQQEGQTLNVELKDFTGDCQSDYVASIINQEGRLYQQVLAGRERQDPLIIVVLGGDLEVASAIAKMVFSRGFQGQEAEDKIIEYTQMVESFEANCEGCNIRVWRLKENPYGRMLLRVRKILEGGNLSCFRPSPADGERKLVGLSMLIGNGIGPARSQGILEKFDLTLEPKKPDTYLSDCKGIGPKLASVIQESLNLPHEVAARPKTQKSGRGRQRKIVR